MCQLVLELHLPQNIFHRHTYTQTDRHFAKIDKSCFAHPKMRKSNKNWKSKIFTKPILFSIHIEKNIVKLMVELQKYMHEIQVKN